MARKPTAEQTPEKPARYPGFDRYGQFFWSESPVDNGPTNWVRSLCRRIREEYLTPAMVIDSLRQEHPSIQNLLSNETVSDWCRYDGYHLWPLVKAPGSLAQTLKHMGRGKAPWNDENGWTAACDASERLHGLPSRHEGNPEPEVLVARLALSLGGR